MTFTTDLHLHSKYSRAVSQQMMLPQMANWARLKGLDIITASDFTHPLWLRELKSQLIEDGEGIYKLKSENASQKSVKFLLTTELSSIYKQGEKLRRIHNLVFAPSLEIVEKINSQFQKKSFNLIADGRPILGISCENLAELLFGIDENILIVPCHVWTPHFGIYGSASGFDSLDEAYGEFSKYIYGVETGLSSDPEMNWVMDELRTRSILSFSDAHSGGKMGREATVFVDRGPVSGFPPVSAPDATAQMRAAGSPSSRATPGISYKDITDAIKKNPKGKLKIQYTIEFYPEEGKYHYSGHRNCGVIRNPEELLRDGNICSNCKRKLTEGVLYRVQQLSSGKAIESEIKNSPTGIKWYTDKGRRHPPYVKIIPLLEIISEVISSPVTSSRTKDIFYKLCENLGSEIEVLLKTPPDDIEKIAGDRVSEAIKNVRKGNLKIDPGYDGEYGKVKILEEKIEEVPTEEKGEPQLDLSF